MQEGLHGCKERVEPRRSARVSNRNGRWIQRAPHLECHESRCSSSKTDVRRLNVIDQWNSMKPDYGDLLHSTDHVLSNRTISWNRSFTSFTNTADEDISFLYFWISSTMVSNLTLKFFVFYVISFSHIVNEGYLIQFISVLQIFNFNSKISIFFDSESYWDYWIPAVKVVFSSSLSIYQRWGYSKFSWKFGIWLSKGTVN